jgi:DNA-binding NarL/FixJ family response regulator
MTTQPVEARLTNRHALALLTQPVDAAGIRHIAFETARRTLCLEHFVSDCSSDRAEHGACATCIDVRRRMKRPRFVTATPSEPLGAIAPATKEDALTSEMHAGRSAVILDEHPVWLDALNGLLAGAGVEVVGKATGVDEAVALVAELRPYLLVAGLDVSDPDQVSFVRRVKLGNPRLTTIILAETTDRSAIDAVFAAGASVYCVKTAETDDLAWAIRQSLEQSVYIAGAPQEDSCLPTRPPSEGAAQELTRRELEILRLVADGHSNGHLAKMLWVTEQTVKFHLSNIYRKLHVANRTEASCWAQRNGLLHTAPHEGRLAGSPGLAPA